MELIELAARLKSAWVVRGLMQKEHSRLKSSSIRVNSTNLDRTAVGDFKASNG